MITQFGSSSTGIGALGINVSAFLIQLATFILAILLLKRFAFKPILKILRDRRDLIDRGVSLGEKMQQQQAELDKKVLETLHQARQQADQVISLAEDQARQTVLLAAEKAKQEANGILAEAEEHINQETVRARRRLENEIVGLISDATEVIIGEKVDAVKDAQLIDVALRGEVRR